MEHIRQETKNADYLVLWLDNDKEGENICFEVLDIAMWSMKENAKVLRAKFSSLTHVDILAAYHSLSSGPNLNESMSVDARQIIDLKVGVAFSRFQTMHFRRKLNLQQQLVSYGPCQTPTLGFCVARHDEILRFVPKVFWRVVPTIKSTFAQSLELEWCRIRTFDYLEAQTVQKLVETSKDIVVSAVTSKEKKKGKPEALNTVQLLKAASSSMGISPNEAMHIAEKLYLGGFMTYPRTESTSYASSFNFEGIVQAMCNGHPSCCEYAKKLLKQGIKSPKAGKDAGDHPPITPTTKIPKPEQLSHIEMRMYEYVSRHFLGTISADACFKKKQVRFEVGGNQFMLKGSTVLSLGFMEPMNWLVKFDKIIPDFQEGTRVTLIKVEIIQGKTSPPDYLSESDLIGLMEQHGIGTDASMATHINNIGERKYVQVDGKNRRLIPTQLGLSLVNGYREIDKELVAPELRSSIEKKCEMIAKGQAHFSTVLNDVLSIFKQKFIYFKANIYSMEKYFPQGGMTTGASLAMVQDLSTFEDHFVLKEKQKKKKKAKAIEEPKEKTN